MIFLNAYDRATVYYNFFSDILDFAIVYATDKHSRMLRKTTFTPYILHPLEASAIVSTMTNDREVLAAAVLHDVVEDTDTDISEIRELFGERVASLVSSESENKRKDVSPEESWYIRKKENLEELEKAEDPAIKMVCLGDKLSNMRALYRDSKAIGEKFWERFNQKDPSMHHWYYRGIADRMPELMQFDAWKEYDRLIYEVFEKEKSNG